MNHQQFSLAPYIDTYLNSSFHQHYHDESRLFFNNRELAEKFMASNQALFRSFATHDIEKIDVHTREFASFSTSYEVPYLIVHHIIENFKEHLVHMLMNDFHTSDITQWFLNLCRKSERTLAQLYLARQVPKFVRHNFLRIRTIHELVDTEILDLFESHLDWLNDFSNAILSLDASMLPILNPGSCQLGEWLEGPAAKLIGDAERYEVLITIHRNLHLIAKRTELILKQDAIDHHYLMMLLKNADLLSHSIGLELAFIHNLEFVRASSKDTLTGTLNRRLFYNVFQNQFDIARTLDCSIGIIMTDIDDFKQVNDRYGHLVGDKVLQLFAAVLLEETRQSDLVFRYGGEEFIIILPVATLDETRKIAEKLRTSISKLHIDTPDDAIGVTSSFGCHAFKPQNEEVATLKLLECIIETVDANLYQAKAAGKNRIV